MKLQWLDRTLMVSPHLLLCGSEEEYLAAMKYLKCKYFDPWLTDGFHGKTHTLISEGNLTCLVCLDFTKTNKRTLPEICGMLIHEATHVWQELSDSLGEKKPSAEFEAYSIQCIAQRLITNFMERGKWKGKK